MKKIVASATATSREIQREHEFKEAMKIIEQSYLHLDQAWLMKRVYEKYSSNGHLGGVMSVYELGRVVGIRQERERRKNGRAAKRLIAV